MKIQKPRNENYCATVVTLDNVYPLSGCDNVKGTTIQPEDVISITEKIHGTSAVFAHVLCKRQLTRWERFKKALRLPVVETEYNYVWSSRAVVKGIGEPAGKFGYYGGDDIWTDVFQEIKPFIPAGWTFYGEITGYTKSGKPIQKGYHYGSKPGEHKLWVYRATKTDAAGNVREASRAEIDEFRRVIYPEATLPFGHFFNETAGRYIACKGLPVDKDNFGEQLLSEMTKEFLKNAPCPLNNNEVPAEGIVLRIENRDTYEAYKLKNFAFKERETKAADAGEVDLETLEAEQEQQCQPEQ